MELVISADEIARATFGVVYRVIKIQHSSKTFKKSDDFHSYHSFFRVASMGKILLLSKHKTTMTLKLNERYWVCVIQSTWSD